VFPKKGGGKGGTQLGVQKGPIPSSEGNPGTKSFHGRKGPPERKSLALRGEDFSIGFIIKLPLEKPQRASGGPRRKVPFSGEIIRRGNLSSAGSRRKGS